MATFRKRAGAWQAQIIRRGHPSLYRTFDTKAQAEAWARQIESEIDRGVFVDRSEAESTPLTELIDRYAREVTPRKKSANSELSRLKTLKSVLGHLRFAALQGKHVATYRDKRLQEGAAAATVNKELNTLSHLVDTAIRDWGIYVPANPVKLVSRPTDARGRDRRLEAGEEEQLLEAARHYGEPLPSIICFALETGMRRGEIAAMRWEHIDVKVRVVLVPETKTDTPRRVPLSKRAVAVLEGLPRRLDGQVWGMRADSITQAFDRVCQRTGLNDLRFHDLRHEATSRLFERGLNTMQVAAITGHKTLEMLKRYTHLRAEDLAELLG